MHTRSILLGAASLLVLALGPGCGGDTTSLSSEMDDSYYRDGQQMERQGRWDEALAAYLKVIDRRGDTAPESNLDAGLIYLYHIKDPIFAIYYFRKYLELEPNSKQAVYVKGLIVAAKREFALSLPGQPSEGQAGHIGAEDQVDRLQRENDALKAENATLRAGAPPAVLHSSAIDVGSITLPQAPAAASESAAAVSPISLAPADPGAASAISDAPPEEAPAPAKPTRPAPAAGARHHTVARGDTLFSLAQKYYGSRSRWRDIYAANRDVLPSEKSPLKIGVDLKIP